MIGALAPVNLCLGLKKAQGLKPKFLLRFLARLKSCPDTKRSVVERSAVQRTSRGDVLLLPFRTKPPCDRSPARFEKTVLPFLCALPRCARLRSRLCPAAALTPPR